MIITRRFARSYARLGVHDRARIDAGLERFIGNPDDPALRMTSIEPLDCYYEFKVRINDRIVCRNDGDDWILLDVLTFREMRRFNRWPERPS